MEAAGVLRRRFSWAALGALALVLAYVLFASIDATPYDDSFFFARVARNVLHGAGFSWNPSDGPSYGLTSQLFGVISVPLAALFPSHFVLASRIFSGFCLLGLGAVLARAAARTGVEADGAAWLLALAFGSPLTLTTLNSGMETSLCLLVVALALGVREPIGAAAMTALVYLARPDAAMIPALAFLLSERASPRRVLVYAGVLGALMSALWWGFTRYYGTALPLPFYAKTVGLSAFDRELRAAGLHDKFMHSCTFAAFSSPFVWVAWRGRSRRVLALLVASGVFIGYQLILTDEIMGYRARFYVPALVPIVLAAIAAWPRFVEARRVDFVPIFGALLVLVFLLHLLARGSDSALERVAVYSYFVPLFLGALLPGTRAALRRLSARGAIHACFGLLLVGALGYAPPKLAHAALDDDTFLHRASAEVTTTRGLFEVARCIPGAHTAYHSEIGVPGLVLADWRVVDLVGLMSRELAVQRPPFDDYCLRDRPEVLFLPHKAYRALNAEIRASRCLQGYTSMVQESSSPLYVRTDLAPEFETCRRDPWRVR